MSETKENELQPLFLRALKGDAVAYQEFLELTSRLLRGFLMSRLGAQQRSFERMDDMVQEILLTIHNKRDLYRPELPLLPWIFTLARHRMIDQLRAEARRPQGVEWNQALEALTATSFAEHAPDDGDHLLAGLSPQQKKLVRLAKVEERSLAEIALSEKMSLSAVKVSIHRSLEIVRKNLLAKNSGET